MQAMADDPTFTRLLGLLAAPIRATIIRELT
jgi:hypothetical protein